MSVETLQAFATDTGAWYEVVMLGTIARPCFYLYRWEGSTAADRARTARYIAAYHEERKAEAAATRLAAQEGAYA